MREFWVHANGYEYCLQYDGQQINNAVVYSDRMRFVHATVFYNVPDSDDPYSKDMIQVSDPVRVFSSNAGSLLWKLLNDPDLLRNLATFIDGGTDGHPQNRTGCACEGKHPCCEG